MRSASVRWIPGSVPAIATLTILLCFGSVAAERPNVLLVTIDTLRADHLSAYGYERPTSPVLDRLMAAGVRFEQARTVEPLTAPGLVSMLTAQFPHEHGTSRNGLRMRPGLPSLPKLLQAEGYRTAAIVGNWTLKDKISGLGEHFDEYEVLLKHKRWFGLVSGEATCDDLTAKVMDWLAAQRAERPAQPWFLWVHYVEPHAPYRAHNEFRSTLELRPKGKLKPRDRYDTEIAYVDRAVGQLLEETDALDPASNTMVIFTSDHGESLGEHNYWGHGRNLYEPTLHIPLSLTWPGHVEAGTVAAPALNLDIPATVAALLDLDVPDAFRGYDWTAVMAGGDEPTGRLTRHQAHRGAVLTRHDSDLARRSGLLEVAVVQNRTKEVFRIRNAKHWRFDLEQDPRERNDVKQPESDPTLKLQDWMRLVFRGLNRLDEQLPEPLDPDSIERLRSLGYAD